MKISFNIPFGPLQSQQPASQPVTPSQPSSEIRKITPDLLAIQVYTVKQVADIIRRNPQFVCAEIRAGNLKAKRTGYRYRIRKEWLDEYLNTETPCSRPMSVNTRLTLQALNEK